MNVYHTVGRAEDYVATNSDVSYGNRVYLVVGDEDYVFVRSVTSSVLYCERVRRCREG